MPHRRPIDLSRPPLTKILATLGPSTDDPDVLHKIVQAGASLFRLNFSHGSFDEHLTRLDSVRELSTQLDVPLAVLADLPGPKIRLGTTPDAGILLDTGQDVLIRGDLDESKPGELPTLACAYAPIALEVNPGERVLINDGAVRLLAVVSDGEQLLCRVTHGGLVTTRKGLNLPDSNLSIPAATPRDLEIVDWAAQHQVDYLAVSFVRRAQELVAIHERLGAACDLFTGPSRPSTRIPLIAKIETPQAVDDIDQILTVCDVVMIARGDLGVELELARVPSVQKKLLRKAHEFSKPCIVATQMLESMIAHSTPTRAEVSDVAGAIFDGADVLMLSGETAIGKYPVLSVEVMRRVALATEETMREDGNENKPISPTTQPQTRLRALAHGAWHMARDVDASIVVVWSQDGAAARHLSQRGFHMPILTFTSDPSAYRQMLLNHAVFPVRLRHVPEHRTEFARIADSTILDRGLATTGDRAILIAGKPFDDPAAANTVAIRTVGEMVARD